MPASVRGGLMAEEYRQLTDGQKMLRYFYEELEAAFERGEPDLILMISRVAGEAGVYIMPTMLGERKNVAEELELGSGAQAARDPAPSVWRRYGSLGSMQKNDLVPLHTSYLPAGGPCGGAAQVLGVLLALVHGVFALPEGHHLHLATPSGGRNARDGQGTEEM